MGLEVDFKFATVGASEGVEHAVSVAPRSHFSEVGLRLSHIVIVAEVVDIAVDCGVKASELELVAFKEIKLITPWNSPRSTGAEHITILKVR